MIGYSETAGVTSMTPFDVEQHEIIRYIEMAISKNVADERKKPWSKFDGDVTCRVVMDFLQRHLPGDLKLVGPNAYVGGHPTEFDLMVVDRDAEPYRYTNSYPKQKTRFVIEVKTKGDWDVAGLRRVYSKFEEVVNDCPHIRFCYLTITDTWNPRRPGSIRYVDRAKDELKPHRVFCLKESRTTEVHEGQWEAFVSYVLDR